MSGDAWTPRRASVLTVGERWRSSIRSSDGVPQLRTRLELRVAGAESNVALALSRLGVGVR